jgi:hypothetical protein
VPHAHAHVGWDPGACAGPARRRQPSRTAPAAPTARANTSRLAPRIVPRPGPVAAVLPSPVFGPGTADDKAKARAWLPPAATSVTVVLPGRETRTGASTASLVEPLPA